jgi:Rad3-related DNA helicase
LVFLLAIFLLIQRECGLWFVSSVCKKEENNAIIPKKDNQYLRLPSPFSFEKIDFVIAKFNAAPQQVYEHTQEVATQLLQRINADEGSLVLFASNKQMQLVADLVENKLVNRRSGNAKAQFNNNHMGEIITF